MSSSRKGFTALHHAPIITFRLLSLRPRLRCAPLTWWCPYSQAFMFIHRQTASKQYIVVLFYISFAISLGSDNIKTANVNFIGGL